uniref:Uncharacterized protein n=1 Tax=Pseudonaja textilis TaxID=8673 RepID=A0A670Y0Q5_PSETE
MNVLCSRSVGERIIFHMTTEALFLPPLESGLEHNNQESSEEGEFRQMVGTKDVVKDVSITTESNNLLTPPLEEVNSLISKKNTLEELSNLIPKDAPVEKASSSPAIHGMNMAPVYNQLDQRQEDSQIKMPNPENPSHATETPIEREIRLHLEREELLRRERGLGSSRGTQEYVEVCIKPILNQSTASSIKPKEKERQWASVQMQREIQRECRREEDLVQLGKGHRRASLASPFFCLRAKSSQSLLYQEVREVQEREQELQRQRLALYGSSLPCHPTQDSNQDEEKPEDKSMFGERILNG